jgi:hypothetical protein
MKKHNYQNNLYKPQKKKIYIMLKIPAYPRKEIKKLNNK